MSNAGVTGYVLMYEGMTLAALEVQKYASQFESANLDA